MIKVTCRAVPLANTCYAKISAGIRCRNHHNSYTVRKFGGWTKQGQPYLNMALMQALRLYVDEADWGVCGSGPPTFTDSGKGVPGLEGEVGFAEERILAVQFGDDSCSSCGPYMAVWLNVSGQLCRCANSS